MARKSFLESRFICCICGKEGIGYGNNAWPIGDADEVCCDECNINVVVPARFMEARERRLEKNSINE